MAKINTNNNSFNRIYKLGFFIILALPILVIPPYFEPPDWGKAIVFRSIMAILLFLFVWQILYRKNEITLLNFKKNIIVWALGAVFIIFLLATIFSVDPNFSLWGSPYRGGGFVDFAFYFALAILAFVLFKKDDPSTSSQLSWKNAWIFSIFIGTLVSLIGIIQYYGLFNRIILSVLSRPSSTMGNPDLLALYLLLLSFITLCFCIKEKILWKKIFYTFSIALFLYTILISGSRAAYLGLLIGIIYFLFFYPKKIKYIKIAIISLLILAVGIVLYVNTVNQYPKFLQQNRLFESIMPRLLMSNLIEDPRFAAWQFEFNILKSKPLLGYGPENLSVGFDRYYDPSVPYLNRDIGWWDRAHNIIIQTGSDAGILGIIAYLALFAALLWELNKIKYASEKTDINARTAMMAHGIQATLIGYFVADFFSFDSFGTYLIFFLLISYSLHLTNEISVNQLSSAETSIKPWIRSAIISLLFCVLVFFLWQYNLLPLQINAEINKASNLAKQKQCDQAFSSMDNILQKHSILDSYARMEYVEFTRICTNSFSDNNPAYIEKDLELMKEAVKIQPLYTRYWIFMGNFEILLAEKEKDTTAKNNLIKQADYYYSNASKLSPKRQEIPISQAKMEIVAGSYNYAQDYAKKCILINPNLGDCYFYLAVSEIYLKNADDAKKYIQMASDKGYSIGAEVSLDELARAYGYALDYQNLVSIYEKLIAINPNVAQYHSSMAVSYAKLGRYNEARQEALKTLQLSPESKQNVDAFLKTLP